MSKPGSPSAYRDELAAAQARIAALEEQLAARDRSDGGPVDDDDEEDDPAIAKLLADRRGFEQTAEQRRHWPLAVLVGLLPLVFPAIPVLTLAHPNYDRVAILTLVCVGLGVLLARVIYFGVRNQARLALPGVEAKLAEARKKRNEGRRLQKMERELHEVRAALTQAQEGGRRVRVAVEDEAEEEQADEAGEVAARRMRRER